MNYRKVSCAFALLALAGCSRSNNLLLGRVEATLGEHRVVVTDCYRTSVPAPSAKIEKGVCVYRFVPCKDAQVVIRAGQLTVNGQSYGRLGDRDGVLVEHGVVSIDRLTH